MVKYLKPYCSKSVINVLIHYMPQDFGFYPDFTARDFMMYMSAVKGLDKKTSKSRIEELLTMVNLQDVADKN